MLRLFFNKKKCSSLPSKLCDVLEKRLIIHLCCTGKPSSSSVESYRTTWLSMTVHNNWNKRFIWVDNKKAAIGLSVTGMLVFWGFASIRNVCYEHVTFQLTLTLTLTLPRQSISSPTLEISTTSLVLLVLQCKMIEMGVVCPVTNPICICQDMAGNLEVLLGRNFVFEKLSSISRIF